MCRLGCAGSDAQSRKRSFKAWTLATPSWFRPSGVSSGFDVTILARLIFFLLLLGALAFGAVYALATLVEPDIRETTIQVPSSKFVK